MQKREKAHQGLTHLQIVADMDERKRLLMEEGDILVAFPGGPGTLEEILFRLFHGRVLGNSTTPACFLT
nr:LOG family protein [Streptococcus gallolyticus]